MRIATQEKKWWYRVVASVFDGIPFPEFDRFFEELYELFRGSLGWRLFPEVKGVLSALKGRGFRLGIISNFDSRLYEVCVALGIRHFFESLTLSSEVGAAKPDPEIFYKALAKHDLKPEESVHIGDNPREDLDGARSAGLGSVLVDRSRTESRTSPAIIIPDLKGLLSYL
jgi:putative hydrolase of the HAD superfamily